MQVENKKSRDQVTLNSVPVGYRNPQKGEGMLKVTSYSRLEATLFKANGQSLWPEQNVPLFKVRINP